MGRTWAEVRALAAMQRHKPYTVQTRHRHRSWYNNNSQRQRASRIFKTLPQAGTTDCLAVRQETGGREPTGLGDMPPELVDAIGGYLVHPRDLASARMASRLFCQISFEVTAVAWGVGHLPRLVAAGAPPYLVAASIVLRAQALGLGMLACAVQGGHDTVVRLILNLIEDAHAPCDTRGNNRGRRDDSDDSDDSDNGTDDDDSDDSDSSSSDSSSDTESSDSSDDDDDGDENADDSIGKEDMIAALALYLDQPVVDDIKKLVSQTRSRRGALLNAYAHDARSPHDDIEYLCSCTGGTHRYACISKAAKSALRAALVHARVDALRVMTRSKLVGHFMGARQSIARLDNVSHMALAASSGRVEMVAYLHDRAMMGRVNHGYLCGCGRDVYEAALKAPRPDALFWMRDNQCDAYVRPGRDEILDAIASGDAGRAYLAMSLSGNDRRDGYGHDKEDRCAILRALSSAAAKGNLPVLRVAIEEGYCNDITPLLAGAASYGRADVVEWLVAVHNGAMEPHMPQPDVGVTFSACQAYTVMSAAAVADHPAIVAWIGRRATCASVAAGAVWSALTNNPSLETVRAVDAVVLEPFPWQRAVPMILRSCSVHVLRFAVKEHGVVIEPSMMCLLPSLPSDDMIDYLCGYFSRQQLQMALDAVCAQRDRTDEPKRNLIDALLVRVPDLCVAVYDACAMADAAVMSAESARLGRCACDACGMLRPPAPSPFV